MSVSPQHGRMGWLQSPGQVLGLGVRVSPECGSTACAELYSWQAGMGCFLASSKAPPHQSLYVGNAKGCTAPTVHVPPWGGWEHPSVVGLGVGPVPVQQWS